MPACPQPPVGQPSFCECAILRAYPKGCDPLLEAPGAVDVRVPEGVRFYREGNRDSAVGDEWVRSGHLFLPFSTPSPLEMSRSSKWKFFFENLRARAFRVCFVVTNDFVFTVRSNNTMVSFLEFDDQYLRPSNLCSLRPRPSRAGRQILGQPIKSIVCPIGE